MKKGIHPQPQIPEDRAFFAGLLSNAEGTNLILMGLGCLQSMRDDHMIGI